MRYTDPGRASTYARNTLKYSGFDGVRSGATDLHNLIAGLERKGGYRIPNCTTQKIFEKCTKWCSRYTIR